METEIRNLIGDYKEIIENLEYFPANEITREQIYVLTLVIEDLENLLIKS